MARKETSLLGIDLNDHEIRVVEVRYKNGKPFVHRAGTAAMPGGCFSRGQIYNTGTLAVALRRLIDHMGSSATTRAVVGLSSETVVMRSLSLPPVPTAELAALVATEVDHYGIVQSRGSAHGFIPLSQPGSSDQRSGQVVVLGVEEVVTHALRELADRSGLEIVALEPTQLSMLRTAALGLPSSATAFVLLVNAMSTDVAFLVNGTMVALRRLDVGSYALIDATVASVAIMPGQSVFDEPMGPQDTPLGRSGEMRSVNPDALRRLELETRRTMDYLQREFPDFAVIDRVHVVTNAPELSVLGKHLADRFGMPADVVLPPSGGSDSSQATLEMGGEAGIRFSAAFGLAMIDASVPSARVPQIDLFSTQRVFAQQEETKRNFAGAIVVSILGIVVGLVGMFLYNQQISHLEIETRSTLHQAETIRSATSLSLEQKQRRADQFRVLRREGVPLGALMDYVTTSIQPGLGLKSVTITPDLKVNLNGESLDESAIIQQSQILQRSPILQNVMINSFSRAVGTSATVLGFTLTASTVSADRIKLPELLSPSPAALAAERRKSEVLAPLLPRNGSADRLHAAAKKPGVLLRPLSTRFRVAGGPSTLAAAAALRITGLDHFGKSIPAICMALNLLESLDGPQWTSHFSHVRHRVYGTAFRRSARRWHRHRSGTRIAFFRGGHQLPLGKMGNAMKVHQMPRLVRSNTQEPVEQAFHVSESGWLFEMARGVGE